MNKFDELAQRTIKWSEGIDLYNQSTREKQVLYAYREFEELIVAVGENDVTEIKDAIGDILVCITNSWWFDRVKIFESPAHQDYNARDIDRLLLDLGRSMNDYHGTVVGILNRIAKVYDVNIIECFEMAVSTIEKRKVLMVNGVGVKWENMTDEQRELWSERNG